MFLVSVKSLKTTVFDNQGVPFLRVDLYVFAAQAPLTAGFTTPTSTASNTASQDLNKPTEITPGSLLTPTIATPASSRATHNQVVTHIRGLIQMCPVGVVAMV